MKATSTKQSHDLWCESDPSFIPHAQALEDLDLCYHMQSRWELQLMHAIVKIDELATHEQMGFEWIPDFICARFGMGYRRACEFAEVALCLKQLPLLEAAFAANELSYDHLRALVQVANDENEAELLEQAKSLSVSDTFRLVSLIIEVSKEDAVETRRQRDLQIRWDHHSRMLEMYGRFPQEMGARMERAIDQVAKDIPHDPLFDEDYGTPMSVKRADALYDLVMGSIPDDKRSVQVVVHVDAETLSSGKGSGEIESGPTLSADSVKRLICDSTVQAVIDGSDGRPIGFGRTKRTAPPRMRQELIKRDRGCRWPGCTRRKVLEAHHMDEWDKDKGHTDFDVMVMMCEHHHDLVHNGGFKVVGLPPYTKIQSPEGYLIGNGPPPVSSGASALFELESEIVRARLPKRSAGNDP